ncbi:MAG: glycoside hydrolase family 88 protein [Sphaerochaeta sp.]|nr:glycoside hydrolase family 88 protein [Sphaerochaeta sp.]
MGSQEETRSLRMVESVIARYKSSQMRWHYEHGLMVHSALEVAKVYDRDEIVRWAYSMYDPFIAADGSIATYRLGEYNLDQINAGRVLFALYEYSGEERFMLAANLLKKQLNTQPRTFGGIFWHKEIYPWQVWLDGLYMQGPFNAQFCAISGDTVGYDDVVRQVVDTYNTLLDEKTGLLYHAWDESRGQRWSDEKSGHSPHFWGRAIGWYAMACLDILDFLPAKHPGTGELKTIIRALLNSLLPYQSEGGMWYQVVDLAGREGNYLESSATAMFAYSMLKAARLGIVDRDPFVPSALRSLSDLEERYLRTDGEGHLHLGGICSVAGLGGNPYRDGSFPYYIKEPVVEDDFKGVGPYVLAVLEAERQSL